MEKQNNTQQFAYWLLVKRPRLRLFRYALWGTLVFNFLLTFAVRNTALNPIVKWQNILGSSMGESWQYIIAIILWAATCLLSALMVANLSLILWLPKTYDAEIWDELPDAHQQLLLGKK